MILEHADDENLIIAEFDENGNRMPVRPTGAARWDEDADEDEDEEGEEQTEQGEWQEEQEEGSDVEEDEQEEEDAEDEEADWLDEADAEAVAEALAEEEEDDEEQEDEDPEAMQFEYEGKICLFFGSFVCLFALLSHLYCMLACLSASSFATSSQMDA